MTRTYIPIIALLPAALLLFCPATASELSPRAQKILERIFETHDLDEDGSITQAELSWLREQRYSQADRNGDGQLDSEELEALRALARSGNGRRMPSRGSERFDALDSDADGAISLDEFNAIGYPMLERADDDGDGVITRDELQASLGRMRARRSM